MRKRQSGLIANMRFRGIDNANNFKIGKYDFTLNKNAIGQSLFSTYEEAMATLIEKNKDAKRRLKNGGEAVAKSDLSPCFGERIFKAD